MRRSLAMLCLVPVFAALPACKSDKATGVPGVTFTSLPSSLIAAFCIRGQRTPGQAISGAISATDCDAALLDPTDLSYYEVWHVRVPTTGTYTVAATSSFDNYLEVYRLVSFTTSSVTTAFIGEDDDSGPGLNALVSSVTLQAGEDYFVVISGYDYSEVGSYSISITSP